MRQLDKHLIEQLDSLIGMGNKVLASFSRNERASYFKDETLTQQWLTMSLSFLSNRLGPKSEYYSSFRSIATVPGFAGTTICGDYPSTVEHLLGVLLAAKNDIERGVLLKTEQLIRAEAFADIHEQATHLLDNGYKDAAAVLFGAVLESALRKLCERQGISIAPNDAIDSMNVKLASGEKALYSKLVQKRITVWADIRNNAAHGHIDRYTKKDVEDMGKWILAFMQEQNP